MMTEEEHRGWLLYRIELDARALTNAEHMTGAERRGRLRGFLEVGIAFGYCSPKTADGFSASVEHGYRVSRAMRSLQRG
jgi:hypothetical protein